jgi:AraC-like DNA-binding protein
VIGRIKSDPSAPSCAQACAEQVHLSFSRFLHLFKEEVGVPFRSFRTWKRARSDAHGHRSTRTAQWEYLLRNAGIAIKARKTQVNDIQSVARRP